MFDPIGHLSYEGRLKIHPPAMQKKSTCQSGFLNLRAAIFFLLCVAAFLIATRTLPAVFRHEAAAKASEGTLTFEERVSYQRAIEEVYWRHRIWPKERPDPKPSLDAVMSQAQPEKKVADYLHNSQALEDYWQRPITAEQLQAEMVEWQSTPNSLRSCMNSLKRSGMILLSSPNAWRDHCSRRDC
jgi:hypothetical protein